MRFAFETAAKRPRKLLTVVTKSNAQRNGMVLWDEVAADVGREFPEVQVDKMLVDAMTTRMVLKPETVDTIVASNLVRVTFPPYLFFYKSFRVSFLPKGGLSPE
jgi:isocitrate/isopropylmalate dehydrogenase